MDKSVIRRAMLLRRKNFSDQERTLADDIICSAITESSLWKKSQTIAFYLPIHNEVDTWPLIKKAWFEGMTALAPIIEPSSPEMIFAKIQSSEELLPGPFGLMQPSKKNIFDKNNIDLIIVPGLAFSKSGFRLGYGKGYYDRYLKDYAGKSIAPAFDFQIIENLPISEHDQKVSVIVTDKTIYPA